MKAFCLTWALIPFLIQCGDPESSIKDCKFTLSGDVTGEYGRFTLIEKGMGATWFICASHLTTDYPQVSVSIKDGAYNGPGTYELIDGVTGKIMVAASEEATYNSYNVANNCAAVFTSESEFTFSCENLEMIQGQGSVSISSGVFSVKP